MNRRFRPFAALAFLTGALWIAGTAACAAAGETIMLWPNGAPGEKGNIGPEKNLTKPTDGLVAGRSVIRLGNVSVPTLTIYRPAPSQANGTAVLVCPGGAYQILAMDLEGTEVCSWLNSIGITACLLKYRVPPRPGVKRYLPPLQDAQRAMGWLRFHAKVERINPHRIGVIGFSAGGNLAAILSNDFRRRRYTPVDGADEVSCRPDFALLIYPAYLVEKGDREKLAPELHVSSQTPPTFITMAENDPVGVENALFYALALKRAHVPVELHVYAKGGHGYGLRRTATPITTWPDRATDWLRHRGLLKKGVKSTKHHARHS